MSLSKRIAEARKAAGLTQTEVARRLGIRPQSVQAWESGVSAPRARRLTELAQVLEVPEAFFFGPSDEGEISPTTDSPVVRKARHLGDEIVTLASSGQLDRRAIELIRELVLMLGKSQ